MPPVAEGYGGAAIAVGAGVGVGAWRWEAGELLQKLPMLLAARGWDGGSSGKCQPRVSKYLQPLAAVLAAASGDRELPADAADPQAPVIMSGVRFCSGCMRTPYVLPLISSEPQNWPLATRM